MYHTNSIITATTYEVERAYNDCRFLNSNSSRRSLMDKAFGAVCLASALLPPEDLDIITNLWIEYKAKFETLIYGE